MLRGSLYITMPDHRVIALPEGIIDDHEDQDRAEASTPKLFCSITRDERS